MSAPTSRSATWRGRSVPMADTDTPNNTAVENPTEALQRLPAKIEAEVVAAAPRRRRLRTLLLVVVPAVLLIGAGVVWLTGGRYVSTDDAYVKADKVAIAAEV